MIASDAEVPAVDSPPNPPAPCAVCSAVRACCTCWRTEERGRSRKASRSGGYLVSVDSVKKICWNCLSGPSRAGQSGQDALA